ncbi:hypothetical protein cand_002970 [Cryptosporidium andersoni]|uniref:Uncharacterized protein n=1 Tax=Cryptosporidium andersoni TaxID=117008 RepID=A0A1J4MGV3_9CRYT|nr:hypothetical protein cand_002970 [Cryptosporidium andersoni]
MAHYIFSYLVSTLITIILYCTLVSGSLDSTNVQLNNNRYIYQQSSTGLDFSSPGELKSAYLLLEHECNVNNKSTGTSKLVFENPPPPPPKFQSEEISLPMTTLKDEIVIPIPKVRPEPLFDPKVGVYDTLVKEELSFPNALDIEEQEDTMTELVIGGSFQFVAPIKKQNPLGQPDPSNSFIKASSLINNQRDKEGSVVEVNPNILQSKVITRSASSPNIGEDISSNVLRLRGSSSGVLSGTGKCFIGKPITNNGNTKKYTMIQLQKGVEIDINHDNEGSDLNNNIRVSCNYKPSKEYNNVSDSSKCKLCTDSEKCFYHRGSNTKDAITQTNEDEDLYNSEVPSNTDNNEGNICNDNEITRDDTSNKDKGQDLSYLNNQVASLMNLVQQSHIKQAAAQAIADDERRRLMTIATDLSDSRQLTELYIKLARIDMELNLMSHYVAQSEKELYKCRSMMDVLSQYQEQNTAELNGTLSTVKEHPELANKLNKTIQRLSRRKKIAEMIQIEYNERFKKAKQDLFNYNQLIAELRFNKTNTEEVIEKIKNKTVSENIIETEDSNTLECDT